MNGTTDTLEARIKISKKYSHLLMVGLLSKPKAELPLSSLLKLNLDEQMFFNVLIKQTK